jgi:molybdate transport system substrate-binding protein
LLRKFFLLAPSALLALCALDVAVAAAVERQELRIAVAANFAGALERLIETCESCRGARIVTSPGASGLLFGQIVAGAPFDLFFSADAARPLELEARGLVAPGSRRTYAVGRLALWQPGHVLRGDPRDLLARPEVKVLAIANPDIAPYGLAAQQVMARLGMSERPGLRIVRGESLGQTFQFVASGNADLGFLALAQLIEFDARNGGSAHTDALLVDESLHAPIVQQVVRLARSRDNGLATVFLEFLDSAAARGVLREAGYALPPP